MRVIRLLMIPLTLATAEMTDARITTQIKMCGMTRAVDVEQAIDLGVDFVGLILAKQSKRCLGIDQAADLAALCRGTNTRSVVLVMDADVSIITQALKHIQPDVLQFHGQESPAFCAQFEHPFVKAIGMKHITAESELVNQWKAYHAADAWVLDAHAAGEAGGSGQVFDWQMLRTPTLHDTVKQRVWLAGGLHSENVKTAITTVQPRAVDVSSGIEASPGVKDHGKMSSFVTAVHQANATLNETTT